MNPVYTTDDGKSWRYVEIIRFSREMETLKKFDDYKSCC